MMQGVTVLEYKLNRSRRLTGTSGGLLPPEIPLHDDNGKYVRGIGTYEDITERKQAEEAPDSQIFITVFLWNQSDPLATIGRDGKIMDVNGATEQVTG